MNYSEPHDDGYFPDFVKSYDNFGQDLDQLTIPVTGEDRKSSSSSISDINQLRCHFDDDSYLYLVHFPHLPELLNQLPTQLQEKQTLKEDVDDRSSRNETKNIPKNYGKAIMGYIQRNKQRVSKILQKDGVDFNDFYGYVSVQSKNINSIADLRQIWNNNPFSSTIRKLSYQFMRKHCLPYIFKSRIKNHLTHIKYREKFMDGLKNPTNFRNIKDY